jgi:uncharacterized protein
LHLCVRRTSYGKWPQPPAAARSRPQPPAAARSSPTAALLATGKELWKQWAKLTPGGTRRDHRRNRGGEDQPGRPRNPRIQPRPHRHHLEDGYGEIIAASQGYETKANAEKGIEAIKTHAPGAKVEDHSET